MSVLSMLTRNMWVDDGWLEVVIVIISDTLSVDDQVKLSIDDCETAGRSALHPRVLRVCHSRSRRPISCGEVMAFPRHGREAYILKKRIWLQERKT